MNKIFISGFFLLVIVFFTSGCTSNKLSTALEDKNAQDVFALYESAEGKEELLEKYDDVVADYIKEITEGLNNHDFDVETIEKSIDLVDEYLEKTSGGLMSPNSENSLSYIISINTQDEWNDYLQIYESKKKYCEALYYYKSENNYIKAAECVMHISKQDAKYEQIETLLEKYISDYAAQIRQDTLSTGELQNAILNIVDVQQFLVDKEFSTEKIDSIIAETVDLYLNLLFAEADTIIKNDSIHSGISYIEQSTMFLKQEMLADERVDSKIQLIIADYAKQYAEKATNYFEEEDISAALGALKVAMDLQPDNVEYQRQYADYEQYLPYELYKEEHILSADTPDIEGVYLFDGYYSYAQTDQANTGDTFYNVLEIFTTMGYSHEYNMLNLKYNLAGKYDVISGTYYISEQAKDYSQKSRFEIYGDEKLLFTSEDIVKGMLPKEFSVSVTDVQTLELKTYNGSNRDGVARMHIAISEFNARKDIK